METKHTPGPWTINTQDAGSIIGADSATVAVVSRYEVMTEAETANARLIAAAPDLLEALEDLEKFARRGDRKWSVDHPVMKARAAIAKAK